MDFGKKVGLRLRQTQNKTFTSFVNSAIFDANMSRAIICDKNSQL